MDEKYTYLADQSPLNQVQFATKDYPSYFDALLGRIKEEFGEEYTDYGSSSVGMILTNIMAYGLSQLSWYMDRTASDCFLETARTLTPVTRLARQIGYKVKPASASTADLTLSWSDPTTAPSIIKAGFAFGGAGGLRFIATADVIIPAGSLSADVNVTEGSSRTVNFTSNGGPNQRYSMTGSDGVSTFCASQSVRVFVNGVEWEELDFLDFEKTDQFEVTYTTVPPIVQFGDGFAGNIPPNGADIRIEYKIIKGAGGNSKSNTINKALDVFMVDGSPVKLTVSNPTGSNGGADPQSIASVKTLAPKVFQSRGAAITQQDYEAITTSFSDPTYGSVSVGFAACVRDAFMDAQLSSYIDNAQIEADAWLAAVASLASDMDTQLAALQQAVDATDVAFGTVDASAASIFTAATTAQVAATTGRSSAASAIGMVNSAKQRLTQAKASVSLALSQPGNPAATINALGDAVDLYTQTEANMDSAKVELDGFESMFATIESESHKIQAVEVPVLMAAVSAFTSSPTGYKSIMEQAISNIRALGVTFGIASLSHHAEIAGSIQSVEDWLVEYFSNDCKSNIVNVKVLVKNSDGFYAGPSLGLIKAVQSHLDDIKEVTHQVFVTTGSTALVAANMDINVEYDAAFIKAEVLSNLEAGIDALLKDRTFRTPLFLSDVYAIAEGIEGIKRVNIVITGPVDRVDAKGNLIPQELEIVTKGSITITEVGS